MSSKCPGRAPVPPPHDFLIASFGKVPDVTVEIAYREAPGGLKPRRDELNLMFGMLDDLLSNVPFDDWEH